MPHTIVHPPGWPRAHGYANAVLTREGELHIAGQIGWTPAQVFERHDFIGQTEQALRNVLAVLKAAGGTASDLVRLTWYVTDKQVYTAHQKEVGEAYRAVLGRHFPAMTMVVVHALVEDAALVEIEATARMDTAGT